MDFLVARDDLRRTRFAESEVTDLGAGRALLTISEFGLTANNITYAKFGDAMAYWDFFEAESGWGRIPVWGFGEVTASTHDDLAAGTRVFGYFPPSSELVLTPDQIGPQGFVDASSHRAALPAAYNRYRAVTSDPIYDPAHEDRHMLLFPLFFTSFLLDDLLADRDFFGAETVVLSSASSKTASGLAHLLARRGGVEVAGLTSARSAEFVSSLGVYDHVVAYEDAASLPDGPAVYIDMAGDANVREAVHRRYGEALMHSAIVGATHHDRLAGGNDSLPGPAPEFFFAPSRVQQRAQDWGPGGLDQRFAEAWGPYAEWTTEWLEVVRGAGPEAVERAYHELLDGRVAPSTAHVLSLSSS